MRKKNKPLVPRKGHTLVVAIVARISGCANQKEMSNEDQVDHAKEEVSSVYSGAVEYIVFATIGKGERLDRPELAEIEAALRSGRVDLLIVEDLGRLVRGSEAMWLFGVGVDHAVRYISPNDGIDTIEPTWEQDALNACAEHVGHNAHTSRRLKFKLMNRFIKNGGAPALPIYGYIVGEDAETYNDWKKDVTATKFIREGLALLRQSLNCSAVADLFNSQGIPVGPYARNKKWDGAMVRRFYANTLLKGVARRGIRHTVKNYEQGRRKCQKTGAIEGIDDAFRDVIERERKQHTSGKCSMEWSKLLAEEQRLAQEQKNITDGIAACGPEPTLMDKLKEISWPSKQRVCSGATWRH